MRIIRDHQFVSPEDTGATIAIGNFDGVHKGHQAVMAQARAAAPDAPLGILTFEPHPRAYFAPQAPHFRLMGPEARASRLEKLGVDLLYELPFNAQLSGLSPHDFAKNILSDSLGISHAVVGSDFCFGKGRAGTADDLRGFGEDMGFGVSIATLVDHGAGVISSTAIRDALAAGKPRDAADMLGHWHRIEGIVIGGEQRGRTLGYPTANMALDGLHLPAFGVYAVLVDVLDGPHTGSYHGVASLGVRPMFGENKPNLETFVFDFSGDLYGSTLSIGLVDYLRGEEKFDSLEALITQMDADSTQSRSILASL
ncbi:MAG: bifunctional riboflavin kinase/FAD synthetase [Rhodobacteraceae bacterium]|nr:bifunctional riboflavin kinase/FAD synthetase [Paracoccaceae bacterium]